MDMKLIEYRLAAGLTQTSLAALSGVSQEVISHVEHGRPRTGSLDGRPPSLSAEKMIALQEALNTKLPSRLKIKKLSDVDEFATILQWQIARTERTAKPRGKHSRRLQA